MLYIFSRFFLAHVKGGFDYRKNLVINSYTYIGWIQKETTNKIEFSYIFFVLFHFVWYINRDGKRDDVKG